MARPTISNSVDGECTPSAAFAAFSASLAALRTMSRNPLIALETPFLMPSMMAVPTLVAAAMNEAGKPLTNSMTVLKLVVIHSTAEVTAVFNISHAPFTALRNVSFVS